MRRITRSSKRSSNLPDQIKEEEIISSSASDSELEDINHVQKDLSNAQAGVVSLLNELKLLRKKNEELVEELTNYQEIEKVSKKKSTNAALQQQVKQLKDDVRNLEKFRARDRAKIEKYKAKEIQHDAVDLKEPTDQDIEDTTHRMRKLLRQFHDLMTINVLDKEEDCPICLEPMILKKCSSLPCQHIVCNECLPKICKVDWKLRSEEEQGLEVTKCPHCREEKPRTEVELVHYSPDQQFDELLEVAQEWARIDRRGMYETSEEEDEEDFLNDKSTDASATASSEASVPKEGTTSKESTPDSDISVSRAETPAMEERSQTRYVDSPVADKRKRMEELAAQRSRKKRR